MVNSFLPCLRLTVKIFQFLLLSTKFLAVLRLSVDPFETLLHRQKNNSEATDNSFLQKMTEFRA